MGKEINIQSSVDRLASVFAYRWGKEIEFLRMVEAELTAAEEPRLLNQRDLFLPIHMETQFLGAVKVKDAFEVSFDCIDEMHSLSKIILQYPLFSSLTSRNLDFYERELSQIDDEIAVSKAFSTEDLAPPPVSSVFHIGGSGVVDLLRIIDWMHAKLGNWALLKWQDLRAETRVEDVEKLGRVTLIIDDLDSLTNPERELLSRLLTADETERASQPTVIVMTEAPLEEIDRRNSRNQWMMVLDNHSLDMRQVSVDREKTLCTFDLFLFN